MRFELLIPKQCKSKQQHSSCNGYQHSSTTLTEVFQCFFLSCKANARVKLAKTGHGPHSSKLVVICVVLSFLCCSVVIVLYCYLCCSMYCLCVLYHCHRVLTQLQLTNISIASPASPLSRYITRCKTRLLTAHAIQTVAISLTLPALLPLRTNFILYSTLQFLHPFSLLFYYLTSYNTNKWKCVTLKAISTDR